MCSFIRNDDDRQPGHRRHPQPSEDLRGEPHRDMRRRGAEAPPHVAATDAVVTSNIEHPSVLEPADALAADGVVVRRAPPDSGGTVLAERVGKLVRDDTFLVSIMLVS
jgi:Aminotransferase class-V